MGEKGAKLTGAATDVAEAFAATLTPLGDVAIRKMFGGNGVFGDSVMFAIVDSKGRAFLRVSDETRARYEDAGAEPHGKMPYYAVPGEVMANDDQVLEWAREALAVATTAKT